MNNIFNTTGFHWWVGVVEDRMDPLFLGRCRVRILGYHTDDKSVLPTEDLPWAMPMQPIISAGVTGVGIAPVGPVEASWVVGFFLDGDDAQQPMFIGTWAGIPQSGFQASLKAFTDPSGKYPLKELLDEPDTNRLARNQKISETIVQKKKDRREKKIPAAFGYEIWDQPPIPYRAKYPFNHVLYTEVGHAAEYDDSPGGERLHLYHNSGTFMEIHPNGTKVNRIVGNDYTIIDYNGFVYIKGRAEVTIDGSAHIYVKNNCNLQVDGNLKAHAHGNIEMKAGKKITMSAGENIEMHTDETFNLNAKSKINIKSRKGMAVNNTTKTTIATPITEVAALKVNAMSITPLPPIALPFSSPSTIKTKKPSEKIIEPDFKLSPEDFLEITFEKIVAAEAVANDDSGTALEYAEQKKQELSSNEKNSVSVNKTTEEISPDAECATGLKVVENAKRDVGIVETGTKANNGAGLNYGGVIGGGELPVGVPGRIDAMLKIAKLDNQAQVKKTGSGYYWCAAAVATWWDEAGLPLPPSPAQCKSWGEWGRKLGIVSSTPSIGAVVLYGDIGKEHHAGIVCEVDENGRATTIEGNTSGSGFTSNGCCCAVKSVNPNAKVQYVAIPPAYCVSTKTPTQKTSEDDVVSLETFIENLEGKIPESVRVQLPDIAKKYGINTPLRMSHFLAQVRHESLDFKATDEQLSYGSVSRIRAIHGKKRLVKNKSDEQLTPYVKSPEKLANLVYANLNGNGDEASGDGYKYRGRGYIQLTGKVNYAAFDKTVPENILENPDLVKTKYALQSAAYFWSTRNLNKKADLGKSSAAVATVTKVVNGGTNGLSERIEFFQEFIALA